MDIGKISQGGQISFDNTKIKNENFNVEQVVILPVDKANNDFEGENGQINEEDLKKAADKLAKFISDDNTKIEYQYHSKFNDLMIKIINKDTNEIILEVPPKKILDLVAKMMEMVGVLFDKKA